MTEPKQSVKLHDPGTSRTAGTSSPEEQVSTRPLAIAKSSNGTNEMGKSPTQFELTNMLRSELATLQEESRFNRNFLFSVLAVAFTLPLGISTASHPEMYQTWWHLLNWYAKPANWMLATWIAGIACMSIGSWNILPAGSVIENLLAEGLAGAIEGGDVDRAKFNLNQRILVARKERKRILFSKWFFAPAFILFVISWGIQIGLIITYVPTK